MALSKVGRKGEVSECRRTGGGGRGRRRRRRRRRNSVCRSWIPPGLSSELRHDQVGRVACDMPIANHAMAVWQTSIAMFILILMNERDGNWLLPTTTPIGYSQFQAPAVANERGTELRRFRELESQESSLFANFCISPLGLPMD